MESVCRTTDMQFRGNRGDSRAFPSRCSTGGNKSQAAQLLGIGRTTLYRKMRTLKIDGEEHATIDDGAT